MPPYGTQAVQPASRRAESGPLHDRRTER